MKRIRLFLQRWPSLAASNKFFWFIVALFMLQAVWVAASANYPMAFDEDFHLGVIRLYANHLSPFWAQQPAGADALGAVVRDPSYLYHYIFSFVYRLTEAFNFGLVAQVMTLRIINIGLFAWGLVLFRRVLLSTRAAASLVHLSLLLVTLIPVSSYLASQINYDNLLFVLTALALLLTVRIVESLKAGRFDPARTLQLVCVLLFASLVKYAFLPIALATTGFVLVYMRRADLSRDTLRLGVRQANRIALAGLVVIFVILIGLAYERYGLNALNYGNPVPKCGQVLDYSHCKNYGPWYRNYYLEQHKTGFTPNPLIFTGGWFKGMWQRSYFAISGPGQDFHNKLPLWVPGYGSVLFSLGGFVCFVAARKRVWQRYNSDVLWLFVIVTATYIALLMVEQFNTYRQVGTLVAINGRYLLLVLPLVVLGLLMAVNELIGQRARMRSIIAGVVIFSFLWGGGALTYIIQSDDDWYWPHTPLRSANHVLQHALGPVSPGYKH